MKKLTFALLLLVAMSFMASAQQQFWYQGLHYEVLTCDKYDGGFTAAVISSAENSYSGDIVIPRKVSAVVSYYGGMGEKEFDVVAISDNAFAGCSMLTGITVPSTVKRIGENVFGGCTSLTRVSL